jgi:hypothetical protein
VTIPHNTSPPGSTPPLHSLFVTGVVRFRTYEVLKAEAANPRLRWAYLPYSMHMAGPREAIQHMIIRRNYGERQALAGGRGVAEGVQGFCCEQGAGSWWGRGAGWA